MFDDLAAAIEGLDLGVSTRALRQVLALTDRLTAKIASAVAAVEVAGLHQVDACGTITTWLVVNARMSRPAAAALAARARRFAAVPVLADAAGGGLLSSCQADAAARAIDPAVRELFTDHAQEILPLWAPLPVSDVALVAKEWTARALAEHGDHDDASPPREAAGVTFSAYGTDGWHGTIDLRGLDGETVATALDLATDQSPPTDGEPARTATQRRGDALVDICRYYLDHHNPENGNGTKKRRRRRRQHPHLNLAATLTDAQHRGPARSLVTGRTVNHDDLLMVACDCTLHRVLVATDSTILDHGRGQRVVPDDLFHVLVTRDQHCRWPGCDRPPTSCDAHHVIHWLHHGPTSDTNCVLLCRRHHRQLHQPGHTARLDGDGTLTITTPNGTFVTRAGIQHQLPVLAGVGPPTQRAGP